MSNINSVSLAQEIDAEQKILQELKKDRDGVTARYFRKIDLISARLEEHCRENNMAMSKRARYARDIIIALIGLATIVIGTYVGMY